MAHFLLRKQKKNLVHHKYTPKYGTTVFAITIILACASCYNTGKRVNVSNSILSELYFKQGSYWIYEDSISGQMDSVTVTNTESSYGKPGPDFHFDQTEHQYIYIDLMEYRDSNNIGDSLGYFRYEESHVIMFANDARDGKTVFLDTEYPFAATYNSLTIHNRPYYHVLAQTDSSQGSYFEPSAGIIKLIIKDKGTLQLHKWELVRLKVII